ASGRATTATAPRVTASGMKSSPSNTAPLNAPKTLPGATLRWSMAKPVTSASLSTPESSRRPTNLVFRFVEEGQHLGHVRLAPFVRTDAEHRRDSADRAADHRRDVPAGGVEAVGVGSGLGVVEHGDDHIARFVHRENAGERRYHLRRGIMAADQFLRGAGLAAGAVAGSVGLLAGALSHYQAKQCPHLVAGLFGKHPAAPGGGMRGV